MAKGKLRNTDASNNKVCSSPKIFILKCSKFINIR